MRTEESEGIRMKHETGEPRTDGGHPMGPEREPGREGTDRPRRPIAAEVVELINGIMASMGGAHLLTSSVLVSVLTGVIAAVLAALYLVFAR
ncbi:hypothetical protein [Streptomyces sp. NPDC053048]|uniref:hypothetical protein n=1 Tax=Streptomyces sp. NPDC053048 TaxID=3365694 RepID=UPI0037D851B6